MNTLTKGLLALFGVFSILGVIAFWLVLMSHQTTQTASSPAGSTFNNAKIAAINLSPTNNATTTSIYNSDTSNRYVLSNFANCSGATTTYTAVTGAGLPSYGWKIQAATTSTSAPVVVSNTNFVMNDVIATGTVASGVASDFGGIALVASSSIATTTIAGIGLSGYLNNAAAAAFQFVWPAGTYLTFISNATSTASCTVGVYYLGS